MKHLVFFFILLVSSVANAGFCTMQLQEEANVFEVNCTLDGNHCLINGYFTHPKLKLGYHGLVAHFIRPPNKKKNESLFIRTYRNGKPKVETPKGYFSAMIAAEKVMLSESHTKLLYFNAVTGNRTSAPDLKCE